MVNIGFGSLCVREIKENRTTQPHILPIYATSSFEFEDIDQGIRIFKGEEKGHVYSRYGNPTLDAVAHKIALLESHSLSIEANAIMFSSGMSAILSLCLALMKSGDKILTQANLYGGTTEQFNKVLEPVKIQPIYTDLKDLDQVESILKSDPSIKFIYAESPANPTLACIDLKGLADLGKKYQVWSVIDNTFATPYLQQPLKFGIDFIIHSTTKYLNGHGNSTAGVLVSQHKTLMQDKIWSTMKLAGTNCNPFDAWLTYNGLKTLSIRMDRHGSNALDIAHFLEDHSDIELVNYPGLRSHPDHELAKIQMRQFGGMLSFELKGGLEKGLSFMRKLKFCKLAPTLGDVDTLVLHPASMSHVNIPKHIREEQKITDGLIRLSVGIEDVHDIKADLLRGLEK